MHYLYPFLLEPALNPHLSHLYRSFNNIIGTEVRWVPYVVFDKFTFKKLHNQRNNKDTNIQYNKYKRSHRKVKNNIENI